MTTSASIHELFTHEQIREYKPAQNGLAGKTILVTGAGDGIGKEAALTYASLGATVILLGKTLSKLEAVYDEIETSGGQQPALFAMNLESITEQDTQQLVDLITNQVGVNKLDGVLHNASILGDLVPLEEYNITLLEQVMKVNFTATFMLTQALLPLLKAADNGSVLFTSSSVGSAPRAFWGAYALSKQAVEGMSNLFTQETQNVTNLRFNTINPGGTRTAMRANAYPDEDPSVLKTPKDIMPAYVYFMSDDSIQTRGEVIALQPK